MAVFPLMVVSFNRVLNIFKILILIDVVVANIIVVSLHQYRYATIFFVEITKLCLFASALFSASNFGNRSFKKIGLFSFNRVLNIFKILILIDVVVANIIVVSLHQYRYATIFVEITKPCLFASALSSASNFRNRPFKKIGLLFRLLFAVFNFRLAPITLLFSSQETNSHITETY